MLQPYARATAGAVYAGYIQSPCVYGTSSSLTQTGLRENASSRSAGVSRDIRSSHSAEK